MRHLILFNPLSGRGQAIAMAESCIKYLTSHLLPFRCMSVFQAESFAAKDWDVLVVIGGDGTLHHLTQSQPIVFDLPILMLPAGTSNLIAKTLKVPKSVASALALSSTGKTVSWPSIDICSSEQHLNIKTVALTSLGPEATILRKAAQKRQGPIRLVNFVWPILITCLYYPFDLFFINECHSNAFIYSVLPYHIRPWMRLSKQLVPQWVGYRYPKCGLLVCLQSYLLMVFRALNSWSKVQLDHHQSLTFNADHAIDLQVDGEYIGSFRQLRLSQSKKYLSFISGINDESADSI